MHKILTVNVYKPFYKDKEIFGISNYSKKSNYFDQMNNLIFGKMKDETFVYKNIL